MTPKLLPLLGLLLLAVVFTTPASAQFTIFFGDTSGEPTFHAPATVGIGTAGSCELDASATAVPYAAETFVPSSDGRYTVEAQYATGFDGLLLVYDGPFDPTMPCANLRARDGIPFSAFPISRIQRLPLRKDSTYFIVITGVQNDEFGPYTGFAEWTDTLDPIVLETRGDTSDGPTFHRPGGAGDGTAGSCTLAFGAEDVPYEATSFATPNDGIYAFEANALDPDPDLSSMPFRIELLLYEGPFDPAQPCVNLLEVAGIISPFEVDKRLEDLRLAGGTDYTLVVTGEQDNHAGAYALSAERTGDLPVTVFAFGGDTTGDPTFNRPRLVGDGTPGSCTLSQDAMDVPYEGTPFTPERTSAFAIETDTDDGYNGFLLLYIGPFDPSVPCRNLLALDRSRIEYVTLFKGVPYTLVASGFRDSDFGPYTGIVEDLAPGSGPDVDLMAAAISPLTVLPGGSVSFDLTATNTTGEAVTGDLFFTVTQNGMTVKRGVILQNQTLQAGQSSAFSFVQQVPDNAPAGSYTYRLQIGTFPNATLDMEAFGLAVGTARAAVAADERAKQAESQGNTAYFRTLAAALGASSDGWTAKGAAATATASVRADGPPTSPTLAPAYPNPFASRTTLGFDVPTTTDVRLVVYDVLGREVAVLVAGEVEAGRHEAVLDAAGLAPGTYLVRLTAEGGSTAVQRVTLVR